MNTSEGDRMNDVEQAFIAAGKTLSLVWLTEPSGRYRIVEPYMVFISTTGKRLFHFFQIGGYSSGGMLRGWKNPETLAFESAQVVDQQFTPREEYNPFNEEMFPDVVFATTTRDGRVRVPTTE
ncbi:MAG TPA: hypothetical protein VF613_25765 [Longimicrobium sp.]|jgi:hypothetical protein